MINETSTEASGFITKHPRFTPDEYHRRSDGLIEPKTPADKTHHSSDIGREANAKTEHFNRKCGFFPHKIKFVSPPVRKFSDQMLLYTPFGFAKNMVPFLRMFVKFLK